MLSCISVLMSSLDINSDIPSFSITSTSRSMDDIQLLFRDGAMKTSSHLMASYSIVFENMLFSVVQMEESKTGIIHLDDVLQSDMELLLKLCRLHRNPLFILVKASLKWIVSTIEIAHWYEFTYALEILNEKLLELVPNPTAAQLQFADRFDLQSVLANWSCLCASQSFYCRFVIELIDFPLSKATEKLFANRHLEVWKACQPAIACVRGFFRSVIFYEPSAPGFMNIFVCIVVVQSFSWTTSQFTFRCHRQVYHQNAGLLQRWWFKLPFCLRQAYCSGRWWCCNLISESTTTRWVFCLHWETGIFPQVWQNHFF